MIRYGHDPQTEVGHFCEVCLREFFGEGDICEECESLLNEFDV